MTVRKLAVLMVGFTVVLALGVGPVGWAADSASDEAAPSLTLMIQCEVEELRVGDAIPITFVVANEGEEPYSYIDPVGQGRSGRPFVFRLRTWDEQDRAVTDPMMKYGGLRGGGAIRDATLAPGATFTKRSTVNLWAEMREPGRYKVVGSYHVRGLNHVESAPVWITVQPRSDAEMAVYIEGLSAELAETTDDEAHANLICKLMYTYDARTVPAIVEGMYKSHPSSRRAYQAFRYYLPDDQATTDALYAKGRERGLTNGMTSLLRTRGCTPEQMKELIEVSLAPENEGAWRFGANATEAYPDDRFADRLIAIAHGPMSLANGAALRALARNRTDESVAVLKEFLASDDDRMRQSAAHAIRSAYLYGREGSGRPLRADDFDPIYHEFTKSVHHKVTKTISSSSGTK